MKQFSSVVLLLCWLVYYTQAGKVKAPRRIRQVTKIDNAINGGRINLPLGEINIVIVTDVHSWISGHNSSGHEPYLNVNYGHLLSFVERLKEKMTTGQNNNLFFVMVGDFMDGTGLSTVPPKSLTSILQHMTWDALTLGNHDIYNNTTMSFLLQPGGFATWFQDRLINSNIVLSPNQKPLGNYFKILHGAAGAKVLTFGFLYEMPPPYSSLVQVQNAKDTIKEEWFQAALRNTSSYNAIMILAHMDVYDPWVEVLHTGIRLVVGPDMPLLFLTGHTHYRGYKVLDPLSVSMESGRYLDTIGFISMPMHHNDESNKNGKQGQQLSTKEEPHPTEAPLFRHVFMDASTQVLIQALYGNGTTLDKKNENNKLTFQEEEEMLLTPDGKKLSQFIQLQRNRLGLNDIVGCSPQHYQLINSSIFDEDSLWKLYKDKVLPTQFLNKEVHTGANENKKSPPHQKVVIQNKDSSLRYDLFEGNVTVDDVHIINPFNESLYLVIGGMSKNAIIALNRTLNNVDTMANSSDETAIANWDTALIPSWILMGFDNDDDDDKNDRDRDTRLYNLYTIEYDLPRVQAAVSEVIQNDIAQTVAAGGGVKPLLPEPISTGIGSTQIWYDFISEHWPRCANASSPNSEKTQQEQQQATKQPEKEDQKEEKEEEKDIQGEKEGETQTSTSPTLAPSKSPVESSLTPSNETEEEEEDEDSGWQTLSGFGIAAAVALFILLVTFRMQRRRLHRRKQNDREEEEEVKLWPQNEGGKIE